MSLTNFLVFLLSLYLSAPRTSAAPNSTAKQILNVAHGELVLSEIPEGVKLVNGDWRFSDQLIETVDDQEFARLPLKSPFGGNIQYWTLNRDDPDGSYILKITSLKSMQLMLRFGGFCAASQIKLIKPSGSEILYRDKNFGNKEQDSGRTQVGNFMATFSVEEGTSYLVYSYHQKPFKKLQDQLVNIGIVGPMRLGTKAAIEKNQEFSEVFLKIPLGVFACLSIYCLLIYYSRRGEDKEALLMFIINATTFFKEFFTQLVYVSFMEPNAVMINLTAICFALPLYTTTAALYFLKMKYHSNFLKITSKVAWINASLCVLNAFLVLNTEFLPNTSLLNMLFTIANGIIFFIFLVPYAIYCSVKTKNDEIVLFSIGLSILGVGTVTDFITASLNLGWPWLSMWGGIVFSIMLARNNALMFARAFDSAIKLNSELETKNKEVESLNASLELKVIDRTKEIKALLEYIPQGVLSIGSNGFVEPNYSAHLPDVLEHDDIAGKSFKDLFLDHCLLSADERDQAWQTILASIGETSINFEVNIDKLPGETGYQVKNQKKIVRLTWNTELDRNDQVKRILVTMLDVTEEYEARRELDEKNKDLSIIRQLIEVGGKKSSQFFSTAGELLNENTRILETANLNVDTLKILFVNIHTAKGAARTLQFKELSSVLHEIESNYSEILKSGRSISLDILLQDIRKGREVFNRYLQVNREVLGRSDDFSKIQIDRDFLEQHYQLLHHLDEKVDVSSNLREIIHRNRDELTHLIFMSLGSVINDILVQAEKIAKDLQKDPPILQVNVDDILINHRQEMALKNSFIHILRNSLDHGIESAHERKAIGKPPRGTINVIAREDNHSIKIEVWDDGRGLAIARLKDKGMSLGLISNQASVQEIANLVFYQGISTAVSVSQISGRGVGMDAVKRFFESEQGLIQIIVGPPKSAEMRFYEFKFVITLPRSGLRIRTLAA